MKTNKNKENTWISNRATDYCDSDIYTEAPQAKQINFRSNSLTNDFRLSWSESFTTNSNIIHARFNCENSSEGNFIQSQNDGNINRVNNVEIIKCSSKSNSAVVEKVENDIFTLKKNDKQSAGSEFTKAKTFSLPSSPINESLSLIENTHCLTDSEEAKREQQFTSFYVDMKSTVDKKKRQEINQKRKEKLLLAHDQIGHKYSNLKFTDNQSVRNYLEEFRSESDEEFSSDSLESESIGGVNTRRCVSDYQIFSKNCRNINLFSEKNTEDFSDTDLSGLNSLRGSGDLLEMQNRDLDQLGRGSSESLFIDDSIYRSNESIQAERMENKKLNKSAENILNVRDKEGEKLLRCHRKSDGMTKKADAFFVEFNESPRRHKPVLKAKQTMPLRAEVKSTILNNEDLKKKAQTPSEPVLCESKKVQNKTLAKKLSLICDQPVLPNKVIQGISITKYCCFFVVSKIEFCSVEYGYRFESQFFFLFCSNAFIM